MSSGVIMVVDDDADIREVTTLALESYGYQVLGACDGEQALQCLKAEPAVTLVLLDLDDAHHGWVHLREEAPSGRLASSIAVIVLSGDSAARQKAAEMGADACLLKPVDLSILLDTVRRHLDRRADRLAGLAR